MGLGIAAQRDLAGHGDILAHRNTGQHRNDRRHHGQTGRRPILGRGARRARARGCPTFRTAAVSPRSAARSSAHRMMAASIDFPSSHRPACRWSSSGPCPAGAAPRCSEDRRPPGIGQTGDNTHLILFLGQSIAELLHAQEIVQILAGHGDRFGFLRTILVTALRATLAISRSRFRTPGLAGIGSG